VRLGKRSQGKSGCQCAAVIGDGRAAEFSTNVLTNANKQATALLVLASPLGCKSARKLTAVPFSCPRVSASESFTRAFRCWIRSNYEYANLPSLISHRGAVLREFGFCPRHVSKASSSFPFPSSSTPARQPASWCSLSWAPSPSWSVQSSPSA
jgi:hypothetical protein